MTVNAAILTPGAAFDMLLAGWYAQQAGQLTASWMLHGRPGVGKTQIVQQLADRIGAQLFDLRLTTIEPQDLRGLPYYDHDTRKTTWYRPEDLPDDPATPAILFLDELTAASPYLQPTVYGLLQERRVGRHTLPPSVMVIAAGNTVEDGAIAYDMGTALADRLIHCEIQADARDWVAGFALARMVHPAVTAFIQTRPDLLDNTQDMLHRGQMIACTPRSWERVSDILNAVHERPLRRAMVAGTVGEAVAAEFMAHADDIAATLDIETLLNTPQAKRAPLYPATLHGLNALIFALIAAADPARIEAVTQTMADIRQLADLRDEPAFKRLPLGELCAFGFELLLARAFETGLQDQIAQSPAWGDYSAQRQADGLD